MEGGDACRETLQCIQKGTNNCRGLGQSEWRVVPVLQRVLLRFLFFLIDCRLLVKATCSHLTILPWNIGSQFILYVRKVCMREGVKTSFEIVDRLNKKNILFPRLIRLVLLLNGVDCFTGNKRLILTCISIRNNIEEIS